MNDVIGSLGRGEVRKTGQEEDARSNVDGALRIDYLRSSYWCVCDACTVGLWAQRGRAEPALGDPLINAPLSIYHSSGLCPCYFSSTSLSPPKNAALILETDSVTPTRSHDVSSRWRSTEGLTKRVGGMRRKIPLIVKGRDWDWKERVFEGVCRCSYQARVSLTFITNCGSPRCNHLWPALQISHQHTPRALQPPYSTSALLSYTPFPPALGASVLQTARQ